MDLSQFTQAFFVETVELLAEMEQLLLELDVAAPDAEQLNAIFRAAHSIKGGAATFGFVALTDTTHLLETLLDRARHGGPAEDEEEQRERKVVPRHRCSYRRSKRRSLAPGLQSLTWAS